MIPYEVKPLTYKKFIEKNKCIRTKGRLETGNASTTYTKHKPWLKIPLLHIKPLSISNNNKIKWTIEELLGSLCLWVYYEAWVKLLRPPLSISQNLREFWDL